MNEGRLCRVSKHVGVLVHPDTAYQRLNRRIGLPERRFVNITVSYRDNGGIFELVNPESNYCSSKRTCESTAGRSGEHRADNTRYNWGDELD